MQDLISRQAAINALTSHIMPHNNEDGTVTIGVLSKSSIKNILNKLPSAQPDLDEVYAHAETEAEARFHAQQRWIPCSERLPEFKYETYDADDDYTFWDTDFVIGATSRGTLSIGQFTRDSDKPNEFHWDACECDAFDLQGCLRIGDHIIAWMPLPESYTEDKE